MKRVGIIGGGQLAWMMADAAAKLGIELVIQTPHPDDPAVSIATDALFAPVADADTTAELAKRCDVITFENEFIDLPALLRLEQQGVRFYPRLESIAPLLDKYHQRAYLRDRTLPTPKFAALDDSADAALSQFGFPAVLKSRRLGYDGQGTYVVKDQEQLQQILERQKAEGRGQEVREMGEQSTIQTPKSSGIAVQGASQNIWLLEEFVDFDRELAVMAARSSSGEVVIYPVVETQQEQQVCRRVLVTDDLGDAVVQQVESIARNLLHSLDFVAIAGEKKLNAHDANKTQAVQQVTGDRLNLLHSLDFVGIMGIEFFLTRDGKVLVNETAPRTHNSGHYSLDACVTSQFEQQLRAVCGFPLTEPSLKAAGAVMVNLLGYEVATTDYADKRQQLSQLPQAHLYWYGKSVSRPGRKLGHVTVLLDRGAGRSQALEQAAAIEAIWYGEAQS